MSKAIRKLFASRLSAQTDVIPILQELGPYGVLLLAGYLAAQGAYNLAQKLRSYSFPANNIQLGNEGIVTDPRLTQLPVIPLGTDVTSGESRTIATRAPTFTPGEIEQIKRAIDDMQFGDQVSLVKPRLPGDAAGVTNWADHLCDYLNRGLSSLPPNGDPNRCYELKQLYDMAQRTIDMLLSAQRAPGNDNLWGVYDKATEKVDAYRKRIGERMTQEGCWIDLAY